jgi:hypothetical protein
MNLTYTIQTLIQSVDKQNIKLSLILKSDTPYHWGIYTLFVTIILLTIARINNPSFVLSISKALYKNRNIEKIVFEELPLSRITNFCLISNFILSFSIVTSFLLSEYYQLYGWINWTISISLPIYLILGPQLYLTLVELISGENRFSKEIKLSNRLICEFLGLFGVFSLLIWIFNENAHFFIRNLMLFLLLVSYFFRIFRGFVFAFSKGLPWYYIILYFCTFELLPLYIVYYYLSGVYI